MYELRPSRTELRSAGVDMPNAMLRALSTFGLDLTRA